MTGQAVQRDRTRTYYNYRFDTRTRCRYGHEHPLYIGKTSAPWLRFMQHAQTQSWFPHVTGYHIYPDVYASEADALVAEEQRIREEKPLANYEHNQANPCRIWFPKVAAPSDPVELPRQRERAPRKRARRRLSRTERRIVAWLSAWFVLAVGLMIVLAIGRAGASTALVVGPAGSAGILIFLRMHTPRRRRRRW